jgi:hypothetical protein
MQHQAHAADFQEYEWLLRFGDTGIWHEKPSKVQSKHTPSDEASPPVPDKAIPLPHAKPLSLELPKVWASTPMTTLLDDVSRAQPPPPDSGSSGSRNQSEQLANAPLVYCLVIGTYCAEHSFAQEVHYNGRHIYKLVRCGSRAAAVLEAFYAAGVNGWNVLFTCVMRLGEDFGERSGKVRKVTRLSHLAEEDCDGEDVRIFY